MKQPAAVRLKRGKSHTGGSSYDALALLTASHKSVAGMLRAHTRGERTATPLGKGKSALRICHQLQILRALKEEILYPAADAVLDGRAGGVLAEARVEQVTVRDLIERIEDMPARDPLFDWTMRALASHVLRQFKLEESELFPKLRHSKLDLQGTGELLASRQLELATRRPDSSVYRKGKRVLRG